MYLEKLKIRNFRNFEDLAIEFREGLNVIIGENNTGKSAIIDALRLAFCIGDEQRDIYLSETDFHINNNGEQSSTIDIELTFSGISENETGIFIELLNIEGKNREMKLHIQYNLTQLNGLPKIRRKIWGGKNEEQSVPFEVLELFNSIYLGALRDAEKDLRPYRKSRLSHLFLRLLEKREQREEYAKLLNDQISTITEWKNLISTAKEKINSHLNEAAIDSQEVSISFIDYEFRKITENLRMLLPFEKNMFELEQNGLGYNNLIYIATVLGDLLERKEKSKSAYISLLIEEPEAHLHPQLECSLFRYFEEIGKRLQVFITSHSPTITSKTNIDSLIVISKGEKISAVPIRKIAIKEENKRYLQRFLDVTKCQLFFAKGVILVEGISEALLLPIFAEMLINENSKNDKDQSGKSSKRNFDKKGIEIININGVAFEPFAELYNSNNGNRLNTRCAILTDNDWENGVLSDRAKNAENLEGGILRVFLAEKTFEYELFISGENRRIITKLYWEEMHLKTQEKPNLEQKDIEKEAEIFLKKLKSNKDKAIFAQKLAERIVKEEIGFEIPEYIKKALNWVIYAKKAN